jgi:hypothetical protein
MKRSSLESPHQDESNGGNFMSLGVIDVEIFNEMITIQHLTFTILRHLPFHRISRDPVVLER